MIIRSALMILAFGASGFAYSAESEPTLKESGRSGAFEARFESDNYHSYGVRDYGLKEDVVLGRTVDIHIAFKNPTVDKSGLSGVLYDAIVRRPDGTIFAEGRNLNGWVHRTPAPRNEILCACSHFVFKTSITDAPGIYRVEFVVKDIPGKLNVPLQSYIKMVEKAPEEPR